MTRTLRTLAMGLAALVLCALCLSAAAASALAAAPEEPKTEAVSEVKATSATLNGIPGPLAPAEAGDTFQFLYKATATASKAECETGATMAPQPGGPTPAGEGEPVSQPVEGLTAHTEYVVCLFVTNAGGETTVGAPVSFTTATPAEAPSTEAITTFTGTTATFEGELNPGAGTQKLAYHFAYSAAPATLCTESGQVVPGEPFPEVQGNHQRVTQALTNLEGSTEYAVCLIATNTAGESAQGTQVTFSTLASKPVIVAGSQNATGVTPTAARLAALVNPENQKAISCRFEYRKLGAASFEAPVPCEQGEIEGGEQEVSANITGLSDASEYQYRVLVSNASGEEQGAEATFTTVAPPSELEVGEAQAITTTSASIPAELNPGGEATAYYLEYGTAPCGASSCGARSIEQSSGAERSKETLAPIQAQGLLPDTTYHYWLVAKNAAGEPLHSTAKEFKTTLAGASAPETAAAAAITTTTATLGGAFNPGGEASYYFEYGPEPCSPEAKTCGRRTAAGTISATAQVGVTPVTLTALQPDTVYHYWLVIDNASLPEPIHGEAAVFHTEPTPAQIAEEAAAAKRAEQENAAAAAASAKAQQEGHQREAEALAAAAAKNQLYQEIATVTAANLREEEAKRKAEALIQPVAGKPPSKPLTRAQKLAKALRVCRREKQKGKRSACMRAAEKRYGPAKQKGKR